MLVGAAGAGHLRSRRRRRRPFGREIGVGAAGAGLFTPFWARFVLLVAFESRVCELAQPISANAPKKALYGEF